jgi:hypothetical protein
MNENDRNASNYPLESILFVEKANHHLEGYGEG